MRIVCQDELADKTTMESIGVRPMVLCFTCTRLARPRDWPLKLVRDRVYRSANKKFVFIDVAGAPAKVLSLFSGLQKCHSSQRRLDDVNCHSRISAHLFCQVFLVGFTFSDHRMASLQKLSAVAIPVIIS